MIHLTSLTPEDAKKLDELWHLHWSTHTLPSPRQSVVNSVAKDSSNKIVAYGTVHLFAEAMFFLHPEARKRDKVEALKKLMFEAYRGTEKIGLRDIYAFIEDPDFALLIEKHFGFERIASPGELLVKQL